MSIWLLIDKIVNGRKRDKFFERKYENRSDAMTYEECRDVINCLPDKMRQYQIKFIAQWDLHWSFQEEYSSRMESDVFDYLSQNTNARRALAVHLRMDEYNIEALLRFAKKRGLA